MLGTEEFTLIEVANARPHWTEPDGGGNDRLGCGFGACYSDQGTKLPTNVNFTSGASETWQGDDGFMFIRMLAAEEGTNGVNAGRIALRGWTNGCCKSKYGHAHAGFHYVL